MTIGDIADDMIYQTVVMNIEKYRQIEFLGKQRNWENILQHHNERGLKGFIMSVSFSFETNTLLGNLKPKEN